jgi:hypothetical protein
LTQSYIFGPKGIIKDSNDKISKIQDRNFKGPFGSKFLEGRGGEVREYFKFW